MPQARARSHNTAPTLRFLCGNAEDLPLEDSPVDLVVSFETIEHVTDHRRMLAEIRRSSTAIASCWSLVGLRANGWRSGY
jgi:ubiquinone/menaquinone biosynthesis C-methylase UbiE